MTSKKHWIFINLAYGSDIHHIFILMNLSLSILILLYVWKFQFLEMHVLLEEITRILTADSIFGGFNDNCLDLWFIFIIFFTGIDDFIKIFIEILLWPIMTAFSIFFPGGWSSIFWVRFEENGAHIFVKVDFFFRLIKDFVLRTLLSWFFLPFGALRILTIWALALVFSFVLQMFFFCSFVLFSSEFYHFHGFELIKCLAVIPFCYEMFNSPLEEAESLEKEADVELLLHFFFALHFFLHLFPAFKASEKVSKFVDEKTNVGKEIEPRKIDIFMLFVLH